MRERAEMFLNVAKAALQGETAYWLDLCEALYSLKFEATEEGRPLFSELVPEEYSFSDFARDLLEIPPKKANQAAKIWQVFHLGWGLSRSEMLRIGKSKLCLALAYAEAQLELAPDDRDKDFLALCGLSDPKGEAASWHAIHDYLRGRKGGIEQFLAVNWLTKAIGQLFYSENGAFYEIGEVALELEKIPRKEIGEWTRERMRRF